LDHQGGPLNHLGGLSDHQESAASVGGVARTVLAAAATTTLSAAVGHGGRTDASRDQHGKIQQLEEDVDELMDSMGIHGNVDERSYSNST